ncbi:phosphotransferase family protein [Streptomyces heilongjiangensis]|uniref:Phosphotransferase family protein n=1 Tax=Streptomyces heilongjiangensis TaxID=945052 RepID=A0ABW1B7K4_9ACTN|nr:aminoglycoside phosphotransferase family protein [Streptomyces heilongjiangensis]MDC2950125.1 aminoglycoside phosphotransferase family protein [Streptomyces heilongjiangensis]
MSASSGTDTGSPGTEPLARPWRLPGWRPRAVAVIDARLAAAGLRRTGPVEDVKRWSLSAVLRCPTSGGAVFHKQSLPSLAHEGRVLGLLAGHHPHLVPELLASGPPDEGWCTREVALRPGTELPDEERGRALAVLGTVQRAWLGRTAVLTAAGCWARTPRALADLTPLAERGELFGPDSGLPGALSAAESARLADACARLPERCAALATAPPGESLVHGDLHPGNWGVTPTGRTVFLDWAEASVGHPFLDVAAALRSCADPGVRSRALDRYFASWSPLVPAAECREVWRLAEPVAAFNQLVTYAHFTDMAEPHERPGWAPRLLGWARALLRAMDGAGRG